MTVAEFARESEDNSLLQGQIWTKAYKMEQDINLLKAKGMELVKENQWLMEKYNSTEHIDGNLADAQTAGEFLAPPKE
jgi:hypothetical protein